MHAMVTQSPSASVVEAIAALGSGAGLVAIEMSLEEFDALEVEWKRLEWYDGLCVVTEAAVHHQALARQLFLLLHEHAPLGYETVYEVGWGSVTGRFIPDLALVDRRQSRAHILRLTDPPLLCVEVASPSTRLVDLHRKRELYARGGLGWYWVADGRHRTLAVLRLVDGELVEVQRIEGRGRTVGPVEVDVDLVAMTDPAAGDAGAAGDGGEPAGTGR
jgi:Uma2 family endonuclease